MQSGLSGPHIPSEEVFAARRPPDPDHSVPFAPANFFTQPRRVPPHLSPVLTPNSVYGSLKGQEGHSLCCRYLLQPEDDFEIPGLEIIETNGSKVKKISERVPRDETDMEGRCSSKFQR